MLKEFKAFILRGNVLDLAVAVIHRRRLWQDHHLPGQRHPHAPHRHAPRQNGFHQPLLGHGRRQLRQPETAEEAGAPLLKYGLFINNIIDFLLVALVIFLVIRAANALIPKKAEEAPAPTTKECPHCLSTIPLKATRCPHCTSQL
jgi:large conductance mechanosensitive channel